MGYEVSGKGYGAGAIHESPGGTFTLASFCAFELWYYVIKLKNEGDILWI